MNLLPSSGVIAVYIVVLQTKLSVAAVGLHNWSDSLIGCYWDSQWSPITAHGVRMVRMTLEACRHRCLTSSMAFFATQGGNKCHCGEWFDTLTRTTDYFCHGSCSGDVNQTMCGTVPTLAVYWVCPVGFCGHNCTQLCSIHCRASKNSKINGGCFMNGTCFHGCDTGWTEPTCGTEDIHVSNAGAPSVQSAAINTNATIRCIVSNQSRPDISWKFGGQPFTNDAAVPDNRFINVDGHSLKIVNATPADSGNYTCRVRVNPDGRYDERVITFLVRFAPKIVKRRLAIEEFEGSNAIISCKADGEPKPKYRFYKDDVHFPVQTSGNVEVDNVNGLVKFLPLSTADEGTYTCRALNDVGTDAATGRLTVKVHTDRTALQATVILMCSATAITILACVLSACKNRDNTAPKQSTSVTLEQVVAEAEPLGPRETEEVTTQPRTHRHERSPAVYRPTRETDDADAPPSNSLDESREPLTPSAPATVDTDASTFNDAPPPRYEELFGRIGDVDQVMIYPSSTLNNTR